MERLLGQRKAVIDREGSWKKLGLIVPDWETWAECNVTMWASHPTVLKMGDGLYRIYYAHRPDFVTSHVRFGDFRFNLEGDGLQCLSLSNLPTLDPGPRGFFDCDGVWPSSVVRVRDKILMYYIGWNRGHDSLFFTAIGLAVSHDGGNTFQRVQDHPILQRGQYDPWMASGPFVRFVGEGNWRMWYISGLGWEGEHSLYHIKTAMSKDGVKWERWGRVAMPLEEGEYNISRMCILWTPSQSFPYEAWYSYNRGQGYRIGYAVSRDGFDWFRMDHLGLDVSEEGWDSEMVCYPWVLEHEGRRYMLYNGNEYGKDGIGLALWEGK